MPFWEEHKNILIVAGSFLGLLFLCWLVMLRGYAYEAAQRQEAYEKDFKGKIEKLCPETGQKVEILKIAFDKANQEIEAAIGMLGEQLRAKDMKVVELDENKKFLPRFNEPLIPEEETRRRQLFVRDQYKILKDYIVVEAETKRRIVVSDEARGLGMVLPDENLHSETVEQNKEWIRQMTAVYRAFDALMRVHEEEEKERGIKLQNVAEVVRIQPQPHIKTGTAAENFLIEYPVKLSVEITLRGLMKLLRLCSEPETFHIVRGMKILSDAQGRQSREMKRRISATQGERWYEHYYRVDLELASMALAAVEVIQEKPEVQPDKRPTVIPH